MRFFQIHRIVIQGVDAVRETMSSCDGWQAQSSLSVASNPTYHHHHPHHHHAITTYLALLIYLPPAASTNQPGCQGHCFHLMWSKSLEEDWDSKPRVLGWEVQQQVGPGERPGPVTMGLTTMGSPTHPLIPTYLSVLYISPRNGRAAGHHHSTYLQTQQQLYSRSFRW